MSLLYYWNRILKKIRGVAIKDSKIHKTSKIESGSQVINCKMDRYSFCGYNCKLLNCEIGAFTSIADSVVIGGAQHPVTWVSTSPVFYKGRDSIKKKFSEHERNPEPMTIIGNDVWIGEGVFIKSGVQIGDGSVIGMGSVVTKDIPPYEIYAGCPARFIKKRFDEDTIQKLRSINWWNWTERELMEMAKYVNNPKGFFENIKK